MSDYQWQRQEVKFEGKWLRFLQYEYLTPEGQHRTWELAERTTRQGATDAVDILAVYKKAGQADHVILVKQYRPPLKGWSIEQPAGLVDETETVEVAAVRELKEETGLTGKVIGSASKLMVSDAGLTNANLQMVTIHIDGDDPVNVGVKPDLEDQHIQTILVPLAELKARLEELVGEGLHVDSRLYHLAIGLDYARSIGNS